MNINRYGKNPANKKALQVSLQMYIVYINKAKYPANKKALQVIV